MKKLTTILFSTIAIVCLGQQTAHFADSIRLAYRVPELSYAVVDNKSILEISLMIFK
jgi:hypothetical protein